MGQLMGHHNGQDPDDLVEEFIEKFERQDQQARDIEAGIDPLTTAESAEEDAKRAWESDHPLLPWEHLSRGQRAALAQQQKGLPGRSDAGLRADLRNARVRINVLERQLAHAQQQLEQYRRSARLLTEMAQDDEPTCP